VVGWVRKRGSNTHLYGKSLNKSQGDLSHGPPVRYVTVTHSRVTNRIWCGWKWAGVAAVWNGSTRFHKLFFYVCRCRSTGVGAGESGIRCRSTRVEKGQNSLLWGLHSGNAVTQSRISKRVHTELKPYRPGSTRIDPHRNPCQFLMDSGSTIRRRKKFWSCSKFLHGFWFRSGIRIDPVLTALTRNVKLHWYFSYIALSFMQWGVTRSYIRVDSGRKGFKTDFYTVWDAHKFWTWPKCFLHRIVAPRILGNWHVLRCGSMRVEPGRHGFNSVWTRLEIWLFVTVA
jgi:hypothetical protein